MNIEDNLKKLNIDLPEAPDPVGAYVAFKKMDKQISLDHDNAQKLANGIDTINGLSINGDRVKTNILYFELKSKNINSEKFLNEMTKKGVLFFEVSPNRNFGWSIFQSPFLLLTNSENFLDYSISLIKI